jgi:hypothetical protein
MNQEREGGSDTGRLSCNDWKTRMSRSNISHGHQRMAPPAISAKFPLKELPCEQFLLPRAGVLPFVALVRLSHCPRKPSASVAVAGDVKVDRDEAVAVAAAAPQVVKRLFAQLRATTPGGGRPTRRTAERETPDQTDSARPPHAALLNAHGGSGLNSSSQKSEQICRIETHSHQKATIF